jgi:hypothetical protein
MPTNDRPDAPAFPIPNATDVDGYVFAPEARGMTLRDYFAARAPAEIPAWYDYRPRDPRPPNVPPFQMLPAYLLEAARAWINDPCYDLQDTASVGDDKALLRAFTEAWDEQKLALEIYDAQKKVGRYFAWRWYYADMMLEARSK